MSIHLYSDPELFSAVAEGDEAAFGVLFNRYAPRILAFTTRLTHNGEVAKGIVQETFLRLWLGRDELAAVENPSAWIYRIAANQSYKFLRRKVLAEKLLPGAGAEDPEQHINLRELGLLIQEAVTHLSEQRRKVYLLSREGGMTIPQIAEALQLSPNTVKNTLVSALKAIREYLQQRGYLLPAILLYYFKLRL